MTFDDKQANMPVVTATQGEVDFPSHPTEGLGMNDWMLLRIGLIGTVITALCCFTPILAILLGVVGLSALVGWLDFALPPALAAFIAITIYALWRKRQAT